MHVEIRKSGDVVIVDLKDESWRRAWATRSCATPSTRCCGGAVEEDAAQPLGSDLHGQRGRGRGWWPGSRPPSASAPAASAGRQTSACTRRSTSLAPACRSSSCTARREGGGRRRPPESTCGYCGSWSASSTATGSGRSDAQARCRTPGSSWSPHVDLVTDPAPGPARTQGTGSLGPSVTSGGRSDVAWRRSSAA